MTGISCISPSDAICYNLSNRVGNVVGKRMARQVNKLNARKVDTLTAPGRHSDGGGLYRNITESGAKSWLFMFKKAGRRREMGLGSARAVPLATARTLATEARQHVASGRDPLAIRITPATMTFREAAAALIESMSSSWRKCEAPCATRPPSWRSCATGKAPAPLRLNSRS